jgi:hypothetical protein
MESWVVVRESDMVPVLECWGHELAGRTMKPGFLAFSSLRWLQIFNRAVAGAGGVQPAPDMIRSHIF